MASRVWCSIGTPICRLPRRRRAPPSTFPRRRRRTTFDVSTETPRSRADALMVLIESFLAEGARSRRGGTPTEVRVHVTEDELQSGGGFIENAGCVGVSAETSRRLACDAAVVEVACDAAECAGVEGRSRAAPPRDSWTRTTSSTGWTAARPSSTTSSCSAGDTTPSCMSMGIGSNGPPRAPSSLRLACGLYPCGLRSPSHRVRRSSGSPKRTRIAGCRSARCRSCRRIGMESEPIMRGSSARYVSRPSGWGARALACLTATHELQASKYRSGASMPTSLSSDGRGRAPHAGDRDPHPLKLLTHVDLQLHRPAQRDLRGLVSLLGQPRRASRG